MRSDAFLTILTKIRNIKLIWYNMSRASLVKKKSFFSPIFVNNLTLHFITRKALQMQYEIQTYFLWLLLILVCK